MTWGPNEIRQLRLRLGWSAAELGRRLKYSTEVILNWEAGENTPDGTVFNKLSVLNSYVEQNSDRLAQAPRAEVALARESLAQVTNDRALDIAKE